MTTTKNFFRVSADDFKKIPGSPIAYWVSKKIISGFSANNLASKYKAVQGFKTGDNNRFLKYSWEVSFSKIHTDNLDKKKWIPCNKGGEFRKWFGNVEFVVNWENDGFEIRNFYDENGKLRSRPQGLSYYFMEGITWTKISSSFTSFRYSPNSYLFESNGSLIVNKKLENSSQKDYYRLLGLLNSNVAAYILKVIAPTLDFGEGSIEKIPIEQNVFFEHTPALVIFSKNDWNSFETSWDFTQFPLLTSINFNSSLAQSYSTARSNWLKSTLEMQRLEEENNRIFIEAYGLQDELTPDVPLKEITLTCNPHYRYGGDKTEAELEELLRADTMKELISYLVGCMFGRYSLDKPGLILANQGDGLQEYIAKVFEGAEPPAEALLPDADAIIPILDEEYFDDDMLVRLKVYLAKVFGEATLPENLKFLETAIGKELGKYLSKDFYNDHVKRYKKRPIYWLFASPKGTFRALIYMHRYQSDTLSQMLSHYLRPQMEQIKSQIALHNRTLISESADPKDKSKSQKALEKLEQQLQELSAYEHELYKLAAQRIEIDLDDGVKTNYPKFSPCIVPIKGMEAEE